MSPRMSAPVDGLASAVANVISGLMNDYGVSGAELGRRVKRSQNYIALRLREEAPFSVSDLCAIAEALGTTPSALIKAAETLLDTTPGR